MGKRIYRRRIVNKDKYSVETTVVTTQATSEWTEVPASEGVMTSYQVAFPIVTPVSLQGMRKVKHLTLTFSNSNATADQSPLLYVIAYVPQGVNINNIRVPASGSAGSLYEPNQFVMSQGVLDFSGGPLRIRTPLSRNLNSGDQIVVILSSFSQSQSSYYVMSCKYAITLQ